MPDRHATSPVFPIAITLAVLLGLYVGAYWLLVFPGGIQNGRKANYYIIPGAGYNDLVDGALETAFAPLHWLDRRIRPHVWEPTP